LDFAILIKINWFACHAVLIAHPSFRWTLNIAYATMLPQIILSVLFTPTVLSLAIIFGLFFWPGTTRQVRGEVLSIRRRDYVDAARVHRARPGGPHEDVARRRRAEDARRGVPGGRRDTDDRVRYEQQECAPQAPLRRQIVPLPAMLAGLWPAITRRQSPPSPLARQTSLAAVECGLWLGARDPEIRRHYW